MLQLPQPTTIGAVTINLNSTGTVGPDPLGADADTGVAGRHHRADAADTAEARVRTPSQVNNAHADVQRAGVDHRRSARSTARAAPTSPRSRSRPPPDGSSQGRHTERPSQRTLAKTGARAASGLLRFGCGELRGGTPTGSAAMPSCWPRTSPATGTPSRSCSTATTASCTGWRMITSRNPDDAADALQDAMLSAHRSAAHVSPRRRGQQLAVPHRRQRLPGSAAPQQDPSDDRARGRHLPGRRSDAAQSTPRSWWSAR